MEKRSLPVGRIKEFLNCSLSWKDRMDLNGMVVKPQCWEVRQQVVLPTPQHKETYATPPKTTLDDIQICVVSSENSSDSFEEKEANPEGTAGVDCVITIEEEIEVKGRSSPEPRIERRDDVEICTVPELQDKAPLMVIDGERSKTFTKPVKDGGLSKVEKATQTEVTLIEMAKICEDYIQKSEGSKDALRDNHQAIVVSQNKPRDSEERMVHFAEPDRVGEPENAVYNNLTAGDKGGEEQVEQIGLLQGGGIALEHARQSFRWYCYPKDDGPRKAYRQLLDLCRYWLKPERRSKEQILELLVMEQFLASLPNEIQRWLWHQHPESCWQAVELMENFLSGLSLLERYGKKALVTFEEVALFFSEEEWKLLDESQRKIYTKVMMENYENVQALGFPTHNPDRILEVGRNENQKLSMDIDQDFAEAGVSPGVAGMSVSSNEKEKMATKRKKKTKHIMPDGPTSPKVPKVSDAPVVGDFPGNETVRSSWPRILPGFICEECGKALHSKLDLARHEWQHVRQNPFQDVSGHRSFAKSCQLQYRQHEEHQCSKCGERFTDRQALAYHQETHFAKHPFHSHPRGFYFNYNLRQNQGPDQQETAPKPVFYCPDCGREFTRRCNLIQHSRIHQPDWQSQGKQKVPPSPGNQTQ